MTSGGLLAAVARDGAETMPGWTVGSLEAGEPGTIRVS